MWAHASVERRLIRGWLHYSENSAGCASIELSWLPKMLSWSLDYDDETGWGMSLYLLLFGLHLAFVPPSRLALKKDTTVVSFAMHDGAIWWQFWRDPMSWSSDIPRWRDGNWNFVDSLLGKAVYSEITHEERSVVVPMPERGYQGEARLFESTWKRPRWFAKRIMRVKIDLPEGIPHAGKGTCSWNCGDDATTGSTGPAKSIPEAVGNLVGSMLERRIRYGGWNDYEWKREPLDRPTT